MNWFRNLKIANKLIITFLGVAVIAGMVGMVGIINLSNIAQEDMELYENYTVPVGQMGDLSEAYQKGRVNFRDALASKDPRVQNEKMKQFNDSITQMKAASSEIAKTIGTEDGRKLLKNLDDALGQYESYSKNLFPMFQAGQVDQVNQLMQTEGIQLANTIGGALDQLSALKIESAKQKAANNKADASKAIIIMTTIVIAGVGMAIILGVYIARLISRPIKEMVTVAGRIAGGDLNVAVIAKTKDETGVLAQAFNQMVDNINRTMSSINQAAEQVASGAQQIAASGEVLSQGSTEQASSIEEITASMTQVAVQTKQNAVNANHANELAVSSQQQAAEGNAQMQAMVTAMTEINESSNNISKIIKVIDEIAFQTNILALNAAVEAARAGQHGKGFAVVAEEVRNLAARSANAAKETTAMIEGAIKKVDVGTQIATDTSKALNNIVDGVAQAAALVGDIATACNEQATAISQINQAITQVSQVVQTNSATAEESAAASEELSGQSEVMKENVARFKLKQSTSSFQKGEVVSPEMMGAIEMMIAKKQHKQIDAEENRQRVSMPKSKIVLDDSEFGKY